MIDDCYESKFKNTELEHCIVQQLVYICITHGTFTVNYSTMHIKHEVQAAYPCVCGCVGGCVCVGVWVGVCVCVCVCG